MLKLAWTGPARSDLRAIEAWLEREASPDYALRALVAIQERAQTLQDYPRIGRPHRSGARILRVLGTPYLLRYRIVMESEAVQILRVHHERQDWSSTF